MAILTNKPASLTRGSIAAGIVLDPAALISGMSITDPYWSVPGNWREVQFNYRDGAAGQMRSLTLTAAASWTGEFAVSAKARANSWQVKSIVISDYDNDSLIINRAAFPTAGAFDVDVTPQFGSGNLQPEQNESFSIVAWVKRSVNGTQDVIFSTIVGTSALTGFQCGIASNNFPYLYLIINNNNGNEILRYASGSPITDGLWHQLVFVYPGTGQRSDIKLYVDGVETSAYTVGASASLSAGSLIDAGQALWVGNDVLGGRAFSGNLDEIQFYRGLALSAPQVAALYNSGVPSDVSALPTTGNLNLWLRFEDGLSPADSWTGTLYDRSGNGHNGTAVNTTGNLSTDVAGGTFTHKSGLFDGVDDRFELVK